jgi:hypothetical protein
MMGRESADEMMMFSRGLQSIIKQRNKKSMQFPATIKGQDIVKVYWSPITFYKALVHVHHHET